MKVPREKYKVCWVSSLNVMVLPDRIQKDSWRKSWKALTIPLNYEENIGRATCQMYHTPNLKGSAKEDE